MDSAEGSMEVLQNINLTVSCSRMQSGRNTHALNFSQLIGRLPLHNPH